MLRLSGRTLPARRAGPAGMTSGAAEESLSVPTRVGVPCPPDPPEPASPSPLRPLRRPGLGCDRPGGGPAPQAPGPTAPAEGPAPRPAVAAPGAGSPEGPGRRGEPKGE